MCRVPVMKGVGKKTLAKKMAQFWKCTLIDALELIDENMTAETEYGLKSKELLFQGQSVPEELLIKMLLNKLESPEVMHFGYVLCDFPSLSEDFMSVPEQIETIRNLKLKPDFLINIKTIMDQLMLTEILPNLVQRPEDILENVQERIAIYKDTMLHPLEELMAEQDSQYLFELDGNKTAEELFTSVILRLQSMGVRNGALITKLQSAEEEMLDGLENDELFRVLAAYKLVAPRYRWRRSRWGRACPVALKGGEIVMGSSDFAVSFLGKMYLMSSEEALKEFMLNPRPYLLPPMPLPPCKILVVGPPMSGRSTLCELIANHYQGKVLEMDALLKTQYEEARIELIEKTRIEAIEAGIAKVKERLENEQLLREQDQCAELSETNKDRYPEAAAKGGWVIDNFPPRLEHWAALSEKGLLPDLVICLKNVEQNGRMLVSRLYQASKEEIDAKIIKRLTEEALKKKQEEEETKRELQEMLRLQAEESAEDRESMDFLEQQSASESQSKIQLETESGQTVQATDSAVSKEEAKSRESELFEGQLEEEKSIDLKEHEESKSELTEHFESEEKSESPPEKLRSITSELGVKLPEYPEDGFPDVAEIEPLKKKIIQFMLSWQKFETAAGETPLVHTAELEIEGQTPEMLLNQSILAMESK
ncbi:hypothetical protein JD844_024317 [Phrynosoma platyrhinos]|uniref:Nucleoside-diphosphate kinase n=1 Tax=Phrynosoma platyrhinos TaxID=52577 RepID=A0ABQ7SXS8_PHRPL|nr:hypothetical protein JD844_024317 [Phrynosoma platyrhinos]